MHSKAVLFDFDGTLADTASDLSRALNRIRAARGLQELPLEALRPHASAGARGLLEAGMGILPDHAEFKPLREAFLTHYAEAICVDTRLFPGMSDLLDAIEARGLRWGIVTNKATKLTRSLGGIKELDRRPDALFVIDVGYQKGAVAEAKKLGIPVIGVVDTNHSPEGIAYVIPGNDDSSRAIRLYARGIADAILEGRNQVVQEIVGATSEEFVEVEESRARTQ